MTNTKKLIFGSLGLLLLTSVIVDIANGDDKESVRVQDVVASPSSTTTRSGEHTTTVAPTTTSTTAQPTTTKPPKTTTTTSFQQSKVAKSSAWPCDKFRSVAGQIGRTELTPEEMRKEFKEINDRAVLGTPAVQLASQHLVSAGTLFYVSTTDETTQGVIDAAKEMDSACTEAGH